MKWFENWFDTKFYHLLYKDRNWNEAKSFIQELYVYLNLPKNSKILDLACGKGRHSKELNQLGFNVTGIDLSNENIKEAEKMKNDSLDFVVGDMRKVYFPEYFDVVMNLFTSFGYFDSEQENYSVFESIQKQLKHGGILIFDYLNPEIVRNSLIPYEEKTIENITFKISKSIINNKVIKKINFNYKNQDFEFFEHVRLFELNDLLLNLKNRNLIPQKIFGDYMLNEFNSNSSPRIIINAQKI